MLFKGVKSVKKAKATGAAARKPLRFKTKFAIAILYSVLAIIVASPFISRGMTQQTNTGKVSELSQELAAAKPTEAPFNEMATAMKIERIGVDVPVIAGNYNLSSQTWDLSGDKVHLAGMTDVIGNTGGFTFLYGHNNKNVLGKTKALIKNDILVMFTTSGRKVYYAYDYDMVVKPEQSSFLTEGKKPNYLAVMTCTGIYDQNRRVMYFRYVGYELQ